MSDHIQQWQAKLKPTLAKDDNVKKPVASSQPSEEIDPEKDPTRYRQSSIELCPLRGLWSLPSYAQLIDVLFDGTPTSFIAIIFLHQIVIVKGRNLQTIVAGLRMRTQWKIEQYDPAKHGQPGKHDPVVEHMEFITENMPETVAALRAGMSPPPKKIPHTGARASA